MECGIVDHPHLAGGRCKHCYDHWRSHQIYEQVADALRRVLTNIADQAAHTTGCIQRQHTFSGATLMQTLVFGWLHRPQATLEQLAQMAATVGVVMRPQGVDKRFTDEKS